MQAYDLGDDLFDGATKMLADQSQKGMAARRALALREPVFYDTYFAGMRFAEHRERWLDEVVSAFVDARALKSASIARAVVDAYGSHELEAREVEEQLRRSGDLKLKMLITAPRGHGKSELAVSFATMLICLDRNIRILFVGESQDKAIDRLGRVKQLLKSARIQVDWTRSPEKGYGPFIPSRRDPRSDLTMWDKRKILVLRDSASIDPTVTAVGSEGAITGGHYDVVIIDDPQTYAHVRSPGTRAYHREWLQATILPALDPGGLLLLIMTRKHHDDLAATVLKDPTWRTLQDQAIQDAEYVGDWEDTVAACTPIYGVDDDNRTVIDYWEVPDPRPAVLWPEERPLEYLLTERTTMSPINYAREYQNKVLDEASVLFKRDWLEASKDTKTDLYTGPWMSLQTSEAGDAAAQVEAALEAGGIPAGLLVVQFWDPSFVLDQKRVERADSDYMVGVTLGCDVRTRVRYLMGLYRSRGDSHREKKLSVIREWRKFAPPDGVPDQSLLARVLNGWCVVVGMERNNGGGFLKVHVDELCDFPFVCPWTGKAVNDPFAGVPSLAALYESGKWRNPYKGAETRAQVDILLNEFHGLGVAPHDDTVLACWGAELLIRAKLAEFERQLEMMRRYHAAGQKIPIALAGRRKK